MAQSPMHQHLTNKLQQVLPYSVPSSPATQAKTIGFVGVGNIGRHIVKNLAVHFARVPSPHSILVWNRTQDKADALVKEVEEKLSNDGGITSIMVAQNVEELVLQADIVITSLASDEVVVEMFDQILAALESPERRGRKVVVDTSTVYPKLAGELHAKLTRIPDTHFITAPVFGAPAAAEKAQLVICLAGDYKIKKEIAYLLVPAAGRKVIDLGGNVEKAVAFKLVGNSFIAGSVELLAEVHTLAEKVGVGSTMFHQFIEEIFPAAPLVNYSSRMLHDDFDGSTGFAINGGLKDVQHVQRLSADYNVPMPILDVTRRHLITARALNASLPEHSRHANMDWSSIVSANRVAAGLDPFDSKKERHGGVVEEEAES